MILWYKLFQNARIVVYRCIVSESQFKKIRSIVGQFEVESHLDTNNLPGTIRLSWWLAVNDRMTKEK